jgi:hypothetical protein
LVYGTIFNKVRPKEGFFGELWFPVLLFLFLRANSGFYVQDQSKVILCLEQHQKEGSLW